MNATGIIRREWDKELSLRRAGRGHSFETYGDLVYPTLYRGQRAIVRIRRERGTWEGAAAWRYVGSLEAGKSSSGEITLLIELIPQKRRRVA